MTTTGASAYAVAHSRVRAMYGSILDQNTWSRIFAAPDLLSLINAMKDTVYGTYLAEVDDQLLTPRRVAYEIRKRLAHDFHIIIQTAPSHLRPIFTQLFRFYEVDNLKAVLRGIEIGENYDRIRFMLFPMVKFSTLPYERMAETGTIAGAIDEIQDSIYFPTLIHALERYNTEKSLFPLEVALDLDYWRDIWRFLNQLPQQEKISARRIIGMVMDNNNLMWAARYQVYHHLSEEEIINYTLPFGYQVDDSLIRSIAAGEDVIEQIADVYPELEGILTGMNEPAKDLPVFEIHLQRLFLKRCRDAFTGYPFNVGILLAYLFILEMEIQDLTVLLEAKSLGMEQDDYQSYLLFSQISQVES